eukprot:sb/3474617/
MASTFDDVWSTMQGSFDTFSNVVTTISTQIVDGLVSGSNAPKCPDSNGGDALIGSGDGKSKSDPLDPKNIADSIIRLEELKQKRVDGGGGKLDNNNTESADQVLEQALNILRHTESIISSIRRYVYCWYHFFPPF